MRVEELLRLETFAAQVGTEFAVRRGSEWVMVKLAEAIAGRRHQPGRAEVFSLLFYAGPERPLQQGIHDFDHPVLGAFELFITPVLPKTDAAFPRSSRFYEAVINRET